MSNEYHRLAKSHTGSQKPLLSCSRIVREKTRQELLVIHWASPTVPPIILLIEDLFALIDFLKIGKSGRTDGISNNNDHV